MEGSHMSDKPTQTTPSEEEETPPPGSDIVVDITNGKKVHFNLDPVEWIILFCGLSLVIWALGNSGLV